MIRKNVVGSLQMELWVKHCCSPADSRLTRAAAVSSVGRSASELETADHYICESVGGERDYNETFWLHWIRLLDLCVRVVVITKVDDWQDESERARERPKKSKGEEHLC